MRTISIAAATLLFASTAAFAQTPSTPTPRPAGSLPSATQPPQAARTPAPNPLTKEDVSQIEGTSVYGNDDKKIGHISRVLMNPSDKKIDRLVVSAGGVLGVGGHRVAIPLDQFSWDSQKDAFKLGTTEESLKSQPEWVDGAATATGSSQPPKNDTPPGNAGR